MEWNTSHFIKGWHSGQEASGDLKFLHDLYSYIIVWMISFFSFLPLSGANILLIYGENRLKYAVLSKNGRKNYLWFCWNRLFPTYFCPKSRFPVPKIVYMIVKIACFRPVSRISTEICRTRKFHNLDYFWQVSTCFLSWMPAFYKMDVFWDTLYITVIIAYS